MNIKFFHKLARWSVGDIYRNLDFWYNERIVHLLEAGEPFWRVGFFLA